MKQVVVAFLILVSLLILVLLRRGRLRGSAIALVAECMVLVLAGYLGYEMHELTKEYRLSARNFYGALRVRDSGPASDFNATRTLTHGTINHGEQFLNPARRRLPTTYYGPNTGVGVAIRAEGEHRAIRVGVIGLGTGTLAAYNRPGDYFRFYEINPLVLQIARTQFTFVPEAPGKVEVAMGDARLSLERERDENFDVLAVDAFSSDSIPVHLLTREAVALYFRHLAPGGILAVHISNRYLNLQPVLAGEMQSLGKTARLYDTDDDDATGVFGATWVLLASSDSVFETPAFSGASRLSPNLKKIRLWTDDYSNLFQILK
jgi:SAM-dependent methyltransferase